MTDWPVLPDEADAIPDELALRVGKASLCDYLLARKYVRAIEGGGKHSQATLDAGSAADHADEIHRETLLMALEALDDGQ